MLLHEARILEQREEGAMAPISPQALRTILELGGALFPNRVARGKVVEVLRHLAKEVLWEELDPKCPEIGPAQVIRHLAKKTGLPEALLWPDEPLASEDLREELGRQVITRQDAMPYSLNSRGPLENPLLLAWAILGIACFPGSPMPTPEREERLKKWSCALVRET